MTATDRGALAPVVIPAEFFGALLPRVDDLGELKVALHVLALASGRPTPGVSLEELLTPTVLRSVAGPVSPEPAEERLRQALDRAVVNGLLLRLAVRQEESGRLLFLPATEENRALLRQLGEQDAEAAARLGLPEGAETIVYRPNVYALYEHHIGVLTPLIAEQLRDAERSYPRSWIEEAILTAVHYNKRSWRYIQTILARWEETGAPHGLPSKGM